MEVINVTLVEIALNPEDNFRKALCIENSNSYEFITLPELYQISFTKAEYKNFLDKDAIFVKEYSKQPQITYMI